MTVWEFGDRYIGDVNIRDVYNFEGVVPCGGFGVRHITSGMLIFGEVRVGVRLPGGWGVRGKLWGMLIS